MQTKIARAIVHRTSSQEEFHMAIMTAAARLQQHAGERLKGLMGEGKVTGFTVVEVSGRATLEVRVSISTDPTSPRFDKRDYERLLTQLRKVLGGLQWRLASKGGDRMLRR